MEAEKDIEQGRGWTWRKTKTGFRKSVTYWEIFRPTASRKLSSLGNGTGVICSDINQMLHIVHGMTSQASFTKRLSATKDKSFQERLRVWELITANIYSNQGVGTEVTLCDGVIRKLSPGQREPIVASPPPFLSFSSNRYSLLNWSLQGLESK